VLTLEHRADILNGIRISFASNNIVGHMLVQDDVRVDEKIMMAAGTESRYEITCISAFIHDSNEIPTAKPMFLMSSNTNGLI